MPDRADAKPTTSLNPYEPLAFEPAVVSDAPFVPSLDTIGTFWPRVGARLIDILVGSCAGCAAGVLIAMFSVVVKELGVGAVSLDGLEANPVVNMVVGTLATLVTHTVCEGTAGTSVGKLLLGYRVVMVPNGEPCTLGAAFIRSLAYPIDSFFFGMVARGAMSTSPLSQRHGDAWASTVVVQAASLTAANRRSSAGTGLGLAFGFAAGALVHAISMLILLT